MKKDLVLSIIFAVLLLSFTNKLAIKPHDEIKKIIVPDEEIIEVPQKFGIFLNKYKEESNKIKSGMFLGNIFSDYGINRTEIHEILQKTKSVFDVRKIKRGNAFSVFKSKDSLQDVKYIVYEKNSVDFVVFDFTDTMKVYTGKKEVKTVIKSSGGVIESALWFAMEDAGVSPLLANDLSEIYAWSVDFFGLQKNDKFKIIYEEKFVEGKTIGFGKIHAAYFEHIGQEIYAIPFVQDSVLSFYNQDGNSLKKAFLKAPLKYSRISSKFSNSRLHPILKIRRAHHGVDYAAASGTPVYALGDGTILHSAYTGGAGNYIKIKHNSVYTTGYMHLKGYAKGIKPGVRVSQGQLIGYVGSTGLSTGPHLDFRVWKNGKAINPLTIEAPPVEPVKQENIKDFNKVKQNFKSQIDKIEFTQKKNSRIES